ncbi:MAG TPA: hypothetical protein VJT73_01895 [Polyangiaceae bacterium]|nr:hypothetical protein [Polyangiaceae bacterium]
MSESVDRDALLCALVLAPVTFSRNRFFGLFTEPWARRTRSRAAQLRTIVRHFSSQKMGAVLREVRPERDGSATVRYGVPDLALERTAMLDPLELAVVRFALSRRPEAISDESRSTMRLTDDDRARVETSLAKLGKRLGQGFSSAAPSMQPTGDS